MITYIICGTVAMLLFAWKESRKRDTLTDSIANLSCGFLVGVIWPLFALAFLLNFLIKKFKK